MSKTIEQDPRWWFKPFNGLLNWLAVDKDLITSKATARGPWGTYLTEQGWSTWIDVTTGKAVLDADGQAWDPNRSMIWNAWKFTRIVYVGGIPMGWAWSSREPYSDRKDTHIVGIKLNGRVTLTRRIGQTDKASAQGTLGPNVGQATGDNWGPA